VSAAEDTGDVFNLYGLDNLLLNDAEGFKTHYLRLSYKSIGTGRTLRNGDSIKWTIPTEDTMISYAKNADGENISEVILGVNGFLDNNNVFLLPYKIKNMYNQNYTSNTISCELTLVEDNGINTILTYNKELFFGPSGSSGNDYILKLELLKDNEVVSAITDGDSPDSYGVKPYLYDYNMKEIKTIPDITYEWLSGEKLKKDLFEVPPESRILKATIDSLKISSYLPIATRFNKNYDYIESCKTITYDITGKKPVYYKYATVIHNIMDNDNDVTWELIGEGIDS
jgi:hypothetical protein